MHKMAKEEVQRKRTHELENTGSKAFSSSIAAVIFYYGEVFSVRARCK
jgi:hypothetical protein